MAALICWSWGSGDQDHRGGSVKLRGQFSSAKGGTSGASKSHSPLASCHSVVTEPGARRPCLREFRYPECMSGFGSGLAILSTSLFERFTPHVHLTSGPFVNRSSSLLASSRTRATTALTAGLSFPLAVDCRCRREKADSPTPAAVATGLSVTVLSFKIAA